MMTELLHTENTNSNLIDEHRNYLHEAVNLGNNKMVEFLIEHGADVKTRYNEKTALFYAIEKVLPKSVEILLSHHADIKNVDNIEGSSAAFHALRQKLSKIKHRDSDKILDMILNRGMQSEDPAEMHYYLLCNAIAKGDHETALNLIDQSEDVDFKIVKSENPLTFAVAVSDFKVAKLLLQRGADADQKSVLFTSISAGNVEMIRLLFKFGMCANYYDAHGHTPLYRASYVGVEVMRTFLDEGVKVDALSGPIYNATTVFYDACARGQFNVMQTLLDYSANVNSRDAKRRTPLHRSTHRVDVAEFLIRRGAEVNAVDPKRETAFHKACMKGHFPTVNLLIDFGGYLCLKGDDGVHC